MNLAGPGSEARPKSPSNGAFARLLASVPLRIFAIFFVIYMTTSSGGLEVADADVRYETAKSWLAGRGGELPASSNNGVIAPDGRRFGFYGPLQSIVMTPVIVVAKAVAGAAADKVAKLLLGIVVLPFISALAMVTLFGALRALGHDERVAFWTTTVIGVATPLWYYGRSGQEENIIALALALYLWGMACLFDQRFSGFRLIGLSALIIIATRWSYLPLLATILIPVAALLWNHRAEVRLWLRELVVGALPPIVAWLGVLWYNQRRFGKPLETGYGIYFRDRHESFFAFAHAPAHAAALLFSPYRGLLWFCPVVVLLFGLMAVKHEGARDKRPLHRLWPTVLGAWLFTCAFIASFAVWNAGAAWGPRYLIAPIVLLAPLIAAVFASGQRWRALIAFSVLVQAMSTMLPAATEEVVYEARNHEAKGTCTPWTCGCTALCLRAPFVAKAVDNTISSKPFPILDASDPASVARVDMLASSDFNSVYWWPVRVAYRAHFSPALAFLSCLAVLLAAFVALFACGRKLAANAFE